MVGVPLPAVLRRLAGGRTLQQHAACLFSTNSSSAVLSESSSTEDAQAEARSSSSDALEGSSASSSSPSASAYTAVKHPPTPGWEFPPVPAGCEPSFAVIRLGNTQHKVRAWFVGEGAWWSGRCCCCGADAVRVHTPLVVCSNEARNTQLLPLWQSWLVCLQEQLRRTA